MLGHIAYQFYMCFFQSNSAQPWHTAYQRSLSFPFYLFLNYLSFPCAVSRDFLTTVVFIQHLLAPHCKSAQIKVGVCITYHKYVFSASKPLLAIWHYMFLLVAEKILVPISVTSVIRLSLFVLHHNYLSMCSLGRNLCSSGRNMDSCVEMDYGGGGRGITSATY